MLFLLCAWQYKRLTQPAHLWIFRALYYLSRSELSTSSLCDVTGYGTALPADHIVEFFQYRTSSHVMHGHLILQLLRAVGTQCYHLAAPLGECSPGAACAHSTTLTATLPAMTVSVFRCHFGAQCSCPAPCRSCFPPRPGPCRTAWQRPRARSACTRPAAVTKHALLCNRGAIWQHAPG